MATTLQKRAGSALAIAAASLIALATLYPTGTPQPLRSPLCILCGDLGTVDFVLNLLLFLPLGAGLRIAGLRRGHVLALVLGATLFVELLQLKIVAGRDASLGDLLANALGGALGLLLVDHGARPLRATGARARVPAIAAAALFVAAHVGTGWGLQRSLPDGRYWGQWRRAQLDTARFRGDVVRVDVNGRPLVANLIPHDDPHVRAIRSDSVTLAATIRPGPPTSRVASIASIGADPTYRLIVLAQHRQNLVMRVRLRASELLLRSPSFGIPRVLAVASNGRPDTLSIAGSYLPGRVILRAGDSRADYPLTLGLGWTFFLPMELPLGGRTALPNALWLALLVTPMAFWSARAWRGPFRLVLPAAIAIGALALLPAVFPLSATTPWEWLGVVGGVALASIIARKVRGEPVTRV